MPSASGTARSPIDAARHASTPRSITSAASARPGHGARTARRTPANPEPSAPSRSIRAGRRRSRTSKAAPIWSCSTGWTVAARHRAAGAAALRRAARHLCAALAGAAQSDRHERGAAGGGRRDRLAVVGLDCLDGTPLLDIKPYFASTDAVPDAVVGWHAERASVKRPRYHGATELLVPGQPPSLRPSRACPNQCGSLTGHAASPNLRSNLRTLLNQPTPRCDQSTVDGIRGITMNKLSASRPLLPSRRSSPRPPFPQRARQSVQPVRSADRPASRAAAAPAYANPAEDSALRSDFRRQVVDYRTNEAPGTIIVDTPNTYLYLRARQRQGDALRHRRRPRRFRLVGRRRPSSARPSGRTGRRRRR